MIKYVKIIGIFFALLFYFNFALLSADLIEVYRKGAIKLVPETEFGSKTDWGGFFFNSSKKLAVSSDGSVFVTDISQHKIYILDNRGELVKTIGQKGCGPGDLMGPRDVSILDNRYIVVGESSDVNMRISIFDLEGRFIDIYKPGTFVDGCTALKNDKIAYSTSRVVDGEKITFNVYIVDIKTKKVVPVTSFSNRVRKTHVFAISHSGEVYLYRVNEGDLLVGFSESPDISVYNANGQVKYTFKLKIKPLKITSEIKNDVFKMVEESTKNKPQLKEIIKRQIKISRELFPEYAPLFRNIAVDTDNNILVFKHNGFLRIKTLDFQVYTSRGEYQGDSQIRFAAFDPKANFDLAFHGDSIYTVVGNEEEDFYRIIKVRLK
jgi:WD40 repeat protein